MKYSLFLLGFFVSLAVFAQSRSNVQPQGSPLRTFPCAGQTIYEEGFDNLQLGQVPQDWTVLDLDSNTVNANISMLNGQPWILPGWHRILDFKDSTNVAMATPSWYASADSSDDWLITKKISIGNNTCLSWYAYSQDAFYPEKYEVRVSETTADTAAFMDSTDLVASIASEGYFENYRSVNLSKYKNKDVYVAFRQTSRDKFILVLDDVRFAEVLTKDLAMFSIRNGNQVDTSTTVKIKASVINHGSDTLRLDSSLIVHYKIMGLNGQVIQPAKSMLVKKDLKVAPNDTLNFTHDSTWVTGSPISTYQLCVWFTGVDNQPVANDTLCQYIGVGTGVEAYLAPLNVRIYPNPTQNTLHFLADESEMKYPLTMEMYDMLGRKVKEEKTIWDSQGQWDVATLPKGIYWVKLHEQHGKSFSSKFVKQ
ncbi:MAG: choice-of-anchor J domain-containing protein [Bacteroidia bacterium]